MAGYSSRPCGCASTAHPPASAGFTSAWSSSGRTICNVPIPDLLIDEIIDDRDVIRKHALSRFSDLLYASATSPAMLQLPRQREQPQEIPERELRPRTPGAAHARRRGGYTGQEVKVARALTGWGLHEGVPGRFYFNPEEHDTGEKQVLGRTLPAGRGLEDGLEVLDLLAHHPSTARQLAFNLVVRGGRTAGELCLEHGGVHGGRRRYEGCPAARLLTPEFWDSAGLKYRRPLEQLVADLRALAPALTVSAAERQHFVWALEPLGHQPYGWFPPDGFPNTAAAWRSAGGLLGRWNLAMVCRMRVETGWRASRSTLRPCCRRPTRSGRGSNSARSG